MESNSPGASASAPRPEPGASAPRAEPDLIQRLIDCGVYEEYLTFRDGYRRWRGGASNGAKGEITAQPPPEESRTGFTYWYPDQSSFNFRKTVSYWMTILFLEGSLLFAFGSTFSAFGKHRWPQYAQVLIKGPYFVGSLMFTAGCYMQVLEVINLGVRDGRGLNFIAFKWSELRDKYHVEFASIAGALVYFFGALVYQVPCAAVLIQSQIADEWRPVIFQLPLLIGGICFTFGGICECVHNRVLSTWPNRLVWWVSVLNFLGDACFLLSVQPRLSHRSVDLIVLVGCMFFMSGATLSLFMWKSDQFGLSLLGQLNAATKAAPVRQRMSDGAIAVPAAIAAELGQGKFTTRSVLFLLIYAFAATIMTVNICFYVGHPGPNIRGFVIATQEAFNLLVIIMILILHSAGVQRLPRQQPFRCLLLMVRFVALIMLCHSLLIFGTFLGEAEQLSALSAKFFASRHHLRHAQLASPTALAPHPYRLHGAQARFTVVAFLLFVLALRMRNCTRDRARLHLGEVISNTHRASKEVRGVQPLAKTKSASDENLHKTCTERFSRQVTSPGSCQTAAD